MPWVIVEVYSSSSLFLGKTYFTVDLYSVFILSSRKTWISFGLMGHIWLMCRPYNLLSDTMNIFKQLYSRIEFLTFRANFTFKVLVTEGMWQSCFLSFQALICYTKIVYWIGCSQMLFRMFDMLYKCVIILK